MGEAMFEAVRAALAGRYDVESELGRGGMATVYFARDRRHRRGVALKVLRHDLSDRLGHDRFLREIETIAGLTHPHILPLHDSGEVGGFLYYVMPYVAGETLRDRIAREGPLPLEDACSIARDVADALAYAHAHGVVHRDIKPGNILLSGGHAVVADFGIARAISAARPADDTDARVVVGTPPYMSPEQCTGSARLDGRADLYSLGCVLYEMLTGRPPFAGGAADEVCARHVAEPVPPLAAAGRAVPPELEAVVMTALAKLPADRFATGSHFAEALPAPGSFRVSGQLRRPSGPASAPRRRRRWVTAAVLALAGALGAFVMLPGGPASRFAGPAVDADLYVVLPFTHRDSTAPELLNGDGCEALLFEGLSRWRDLRVVDPLRVYDAKLRRGGAPGRLDEALALAAELGAGRLVWGQTWALRDTVHVRAAIFDVPSGRTVRQHTVRIPETGADLPGAFTALADSLLGGGLFRAGAGAVGTRVLGAWRRFSAGHDALTRWDLPGAEAEFQAAVRLDGGYAQAEYWLAQVRAWGDRPPAEWGPLAAAALAQPDGLSPRYRARASALVAMAEERYPDACDQYAALVVRDSLDFTAWYGLGECRVRDRAVLPDPTSPSGWRYRASQHAAVQAFTAALRLVPSVHRAFGVQAMERLRDWLFIDAYQYRPGTARDDASLHFAAFPELVADTLAFTPSPLPEALDRPDQPRSMPAALERNRRLLVQITSNWVAAFPEEASLREVLATALESLGELDNPRGEPSALAEIRAGRRLAADSLLALRLATSEVRVLLKLRRYREAVELADRILAAHPDPGADDAVPLAALALLTGRVHRGAELLARVGRLDYVDAASGDSVALPRSAQREALRLLAYAAAGGPADSLRAGLRRVDGLITGFVPPLERARRRFVALQVVEGFAFPVIGAGESHTVDGANFLLDFENLLLRGDTADLRRRLEELERARRQASVGGVAPDYAFMEAWLWLRMGDSAAAARRLDQILEGVRGVGGDLLGPIAMVAPQAPALVRAMILRADLAAATGDTATARRWAEPAATLWRSAAPELQDDVRRMRRLAR